MRHEVRKSRRAQQSDFSKDNVNNKDKFSSFIENCVSQQVILNNGR